MKIGDNYIDFTALDQNGTEVKLSEELSKHKVILYFYPKDMTSGCTAEACSLRDGYGELKNMGFEIIGVSPDNEASHKKFTEKYTLPFRLIADTDKSIAMSYGVWGEKKFMGKTYMGIIRKTFVISMDGKIEKIFEKVNTKAHFEQIADSYK